MLYVASVNNPDSLGLVVADPKRSDMGYVDGRGGTARGGSPSVAPSPAPGEGGGPNTARAAPEKNIGPDGLPLVKPPWGTIVAIDLNKGEIAWKVANADAPEYVKAHPLLKGVDVGRTGRPSRSPLMVTKTLLFSADGANLFNAVAGGGGNTFRALDKKTGAVLHEMQLPAYATGIPMTYMADGRQFIVVAVGAIGVPAELVALALP